MVRPRHAPKLRNYINYGVAFVLVCKDYLNETTQYSGREKTLDALSRWEEAEKEILKLGYRPLSLIELEQSRLEDEDVSDLGFISIRENDELGVSHARAYRKFIMGKISIFSLVPFEGLDFGKYSLPETKIYTDRIRDRFNSKIEKIIENKRKEGVNEKKLRKLKKSLIKHYQQKLLRGL